MKRPAYLPVFVIVATALLIVFILALIKNTLIYPYDTDGDYNYTFPCEDAKVINLELKNGKVVLPRKQSLFQTTFLKVNIQATFLGKVFQPVITLVGHERTLKQHIEHGSNGVRFLNISQFISKSQTTLRLIGNNLSIKDQTIQLISFSNQDISQLKVLVVAPHPDDAEIAAYGLYSDSNNSFILTVTAGDAGGNTYDELYANRGVQYLKKGKLRTWNSLVVPMLGGVSPEQTINLGFFDSTLKKMFANKSKTIAGLYTGITDVDYFRNQNISTLSNGLTGGSNWKSLVNNIEYILMATKPDIIVAPYPNLDSHYDHKLSTVALFEAIRRLGIKKGYLYLYTNHLVLNEYYPYGEGGSLVSLPPNFKRGQYFDSIYSHPLSLRKQKDKVLVLESMNDLRPDTEWRFFKGSIKQVIRVIKRNLLGDYSYYRRAVRSNELFFVINIKNIYDREISRNIVGEL